MIEISMIHAVNWDPSRENYWTKEEEAKWDIMVAELNKFFDGTIEDKLKFVMEDEEWTMFLLKYGEIIYKVEYL